MRYSHFSKNERNEPAVLLKKGYSLRIIASVLKKSPSSVSREVKKNNVATSGFYDSRIANHKAYKRRWLSKYRSMKIRDNSKLEEYIKVRMSKG